MYTRLRGGFIVMIGLLTGSALFAGTVGPVATITARVLKVTDARANSATYDASAIGKRLQVGDKVRTGLRAKAEITLDDKSVVRLGQATDITINPSREIDLPKGTIQFDFKNPARIRAGSTVADVRGSTGTVSVADDGSLNVVLFSGAMTLRTANAQRPQFNLQAGQTANVPRQPNQAPRLGVAPPQQFMNPQTGQVHQHNPLGDQALGGRNVRQTVGSQVGNEIRQTSLRIVQDQGVNLRGPLAGQAAQFIANRRRGRVIGRFEAPDHSSRLLGNADASAAIPPVDPGTGYFAPHSNGNLFAYEGQDGTGYATMRLLTYGAGGPLYYEFAVQPTMQFRESFTQVDYTDAFVIYKDRRLGDFTIGRQRFLKGPVQNTVFGTLLRQGGTDIKDAVTWSPRWGTQAVQSDFAFLYDAFPRGTATAVASTQNGFLTRHSIDTDFGTVGVSAIRLQGVSVLGTTLDWSVPLVAEEVDFYGEFGRDNAGAQLRTFGLYFPGLHERTGFDVFLEQTKMADFLLPTPGGTRTINSEWLLRVYRQLTKDLSALVSVDKITGDSAKAGFGLVYRLRF